MVRLCSTCRQPRHDLKNVSMLEQTPRHNYCIHFSHAFVMEFILCNHLISYLKQRSFNNDYNFRLQQLKQQHEKQIKRLNATIYLGDYNHHDNSISTMHHNMTLIVSFN